MKTFLNPGIFLLFISTYLKRYGTYLVVLISTGCFAQLNSPLPSPEMLPAVAGKALPTNSLPPGNDILPVSLNQGKQIANKNLVPQFSGYNKTVLPGESLSLTGINFSLKSQGDTGVPLKFVIGYFNSKGNLIIKPLDCSYFEMNKAIVAVSDSLPFGIYIIWAANKHGWGRPVIINRPELWWVGPEDAVADDTVSFYGTNLSKISGEGKATWLYIRANNSSKQEYWLKAANSNNYKAAFLLRGIAEGEYTAWIQNGLADKLGFSEPQRLSVKKQIRWGTKKFNVRDPQFGAKGDGKTDDEAAIQKCLNEAAKFPYSTVYFPAGIYKVSQGFNPPSNTEWVGDGKEKTQLLLAANFVYNPASARQYTLLFGNENSVQCSNIRFGNMSFKVQQGAIGKMNSIVYMRGSVNIRFYNCLIEASPGFERLDMSNSRNISFEGGELILNGAFFSNARQFFFKNMVYKGILDANVMLEFWGCNGVSVTGCLARDKDKSDKGQAIGRFLYGNNIWGSNINIYVANNTTSDMAPRKSKAVDQNSGEQYLWEGTNIVYLGKGVSVATDVLSVKNFNQGQNTAFPTLNMGVFIINGKGLGQYRTIKKVDQSRVTLSGPWELEPDSSSVFMISSYSGNCVLYKNVIDGKAERIRDDIGSSGIQLYGNTINFICDGNYIKDVVTGISTWAQIGGYERNSNVQSFCYFNEFRNNTCENVQTGLSISAFNWYNEANPNYRLYVGNAFIKNTLKNCINTAINMDARQMANDNIDVSFFVRNKFISNTRNLKVNNAPKTGKGIMKKSMETFGNIQIPDNQAW